MKRILFLVTALIFLHYSKSAQDNIARLNSQLEFADRTEKIVIYNQLAEEYLNQDPEKSLFNAKEALKIANKTGIDSLIAKAQKNIGTAFYFLGNFSEAQRFYDYSLNNYNKINHNSGIATVLNNLGLVYKKKNELDKALEYYLESIRIEQVLGNRQGIAMSLANIGNIYYELNDHDKALDYFKQALSIYEEIKDKPGISTILNNIGMIFDESRNYNVALDYYFQSLYLDEELGNSRGMATTYNNIGIAYINLDLPGKAEEYLTKSLTLTTRIGEKYGIANTNLNLGYLFLGENRNILAKEHLEKALVIALELGAIDLIESSYKYLSDLYNNLKDYKKSLEFYRLYTDRIIQNYEDDYLLNIRKIENRYHTSDKFREKSSFFPFQNSFTKYFLIVALFLIIIIIFLIYSRFRIKSKYIKEFENKNKELKEIASTDPVTGMINRREVINHIEYEIYKFERYNRPFVVVMCDIDDFKNLNDKYGHACGDYVLKELAILMDIGSRKQDIVGRWGGDEFLMLLPETNIYGGLILSEKIKERIKQKNFFYKGNDIYITVTFGISSYTEITEIDEIIKEADDALYEGKRKGKDCVVQYKSY